MDKDNQPKHPAEIDLDKELAEINRLNSGFVDEDEPAPVVEPAKPDVPAEPAKPADVTPPAPQPEAKVDEPAKPAVNADVAKPEDNTQKPPERVERYIPIPKWKEANRVWEEEKAGYKKRISELENISAKRESAEARDKRIKEYAEKHGLDEEQVRGLVELADAGKTITTDQVQDAGKPADAPAVIPPVPAKPADPVQPQPGQPAAPTPEEVEFFGQEFESEVAPIIKAKYPNATPEAIKKVRERLDVLAHSKELHRTPLKYIFGGESEEMGALLAGETAKPAPGQRTLESYRPGSGKPSTLSAKDFKGQKDFAALETMSPDDRSKIVKDLEPEDYMNYIAYEGAKDEGVTVRRGDKTIVLK